MGPVGVGKTFVATALGHAAVRRRYTVAFHRTDVLLKRLRASRLDNSHDAEMRRLLRVDLLILDDFALQGMDALDTSDLYDYAARVTMPRSRPRAFSRQGLDVGLSA
jgi:DNA replication protein DnaC